MDASIAPDVLVQDAVDPGAFHTVNDGGVVCHLHPVITTLKQAVFKLNDVARHHLAGDGLAKDVPMSLIVTRPGGTKGFKGKCPAFPVSNLTS